MEFSVSKEDLQILLGKAAGTVSTKDVQLILKNFLIKASGSKLEVMATDMSLGALAGIPVSTISREGVAAVPAKKLMNLVNAVASKSMLLFKLEGQVLTIYVEYKKEKDKESYRSKAVLHCMDPDVYPEFPSYDPDAVVVTELKPFLEGLAAISFASSDTELKANLMAVYVDGGVMYSADGHRACKWEIKDCNLQDLMIPNSAVHLLVKLLRDSAASDIKVYQTKFHILFRVGSEIYHCRKMEHQFPDLEKRVFSKCVGYDWKLKFPRTRLLESIRCAKVTADESAVMYMTYVDEGMSGKLIVRSQDSVEDSFEEHVPGCEWDGDQFFDRAINFEYLEDVLNTLKGEQMVEISLGEDKGTRKSMFLFKTSKLSAVIMPHRVPKSKKDQVHKRVQKHKDAAEAKEAMGAQA